MTGHFNGRVEDNGALGLTVVFPKDFTIVATVNIQAALELHPERSILNFRELLVVGVLGGKDYPSRALESFFDNKVLVAHGIYGCVGVYVLLTVWNQYCPSS